jgi:hypothetical protein
MLTLEYSTLEWGPERLRQQIRQKDRSTSWWKLSLTYLPLAKVALAEKSTCEFFLLIFSHRSAAPQLVSSYLVGVLTGRLNAILLCRYFGPCIGTTWFPYIKLVPGRPSLAFCAKKMMKCFWKELCRMNFHCKTECQMLWKMTSVVHNYSTRKKGFISVDLGFVHARLGPTFFQHGQLIGDLSVRFIKRRPLKWMDIFSGHVWTIRARFALIRILVYIFSNGNFFKC